MTLSERYEELRGVPTPRTVPALDAAEAILSDGALHPQAMLVKAMSSQSDILPASALGVLRALVHAGILEATYETKVVQKNGQFRSVHRNLKYRLT